MKSICVFCGSNQGNKKIFSIAAKNLASELMRRKISLVYGGATIGLMGILANTVLELGGQVTGIIPAALFPKEIPHQNLTRIHVVESMHERKQLMYDSSDGFIALPGGLGTLDELCEILTWAQLGLHQKPCGILNIDGYYDALLEFFEESIRRKFMRKEHRDMILVDSTAEGLLNQFETYRPVFLKKWIKPEET